MSKTIPLVLLYVVHAQVMFAFSSHKVANSATGNPISQIIHADGTVNLSSGYSGAIPLSGYQVRLDPCLGPVLQPAPPPTGWQTMGTGLDNAVNAIAVSGSNVYVGGEFTQAGGLAAGYIAKWDGSTWSALGLGLNNACYALAVRNDTLYAGGFFTIAGGVAANYVAMWDGSTWSAMGSGFNGYCFSLALSTGKRLYAGGIFTQAGNVPANYIASWNGNNWTPLGNGLGDACFAITTNNTDVYAGGFFTTAGNAPAGYIAKWDANGWSALGSGLSGECLSLTFSQGKLYAGGNFLVAGGSPANRIALWNGASWSALGGGLNGPCLALSAVGPNILAGGVFTKASGQTVNYVAWWDGAAWQPLGLGLDFACTSLAIKGSDVFVGGYFSEAGGSPANFIARYVEPILPVELTDFYATVQNKQVRLEWITLTETNNYGFYLERSSDGRTWTDLQFIAGQGTTLNAHAYYFTDKSPLAGINYYRLRQEDFDGSTHYSNVLSATVEAEDILLGVSPNPAGESVRLYFSHSDFSGPAVVTVFDANGRLSLQQTLGFEDGVATVVIDLAGLTGGVYLVRVVTAQDGYSTRMVKH